MTNKRSPAGEMAYRLCQEMPSAPTRTLARVLRHKAPKMFPTYEAARNRVRYYRGELGKSHRRNIKKHDVRVSKPKHFSVEKPDVQLDDVSAVPLAETGDGLIIGDLQMPYHDAEAVDTAINYAIQKNHDRYCIINGDLMDCHRISRWSRDPMSRRIASEAEMVRRFLRQICDVFGAVYWKLGNHEARWQNYMETAAPELLGIDAFRFERVMEAEQIGYTIVEDYRFIQAGALTIVHGHETGRSFSSPVNPARGLYLKARDNALCGHHHRTSTQPSRTIRGRTVTCWSIGCLCNLHPRFLPHNEWDHGLGLLSFDGKDFEVTPRKIINGRPY